MNLTQTALKRPVSVLIIVLALIVFGISAIMGAPMELTPPIEMPYLMVMTTYGGAGPEEIEELVSRPLEGAVSTLNGVKSVQSISQENVSMLMLELEYGTDMNLAHMDLQEKINMYKNSLPEDASTPIIMELSMDMLPSIVLSAVSTGDVDLRYYVEEEIVPNFEKLGGVASVDVSGGQKDYIRIQLKEDRMNQYRLDMATIAGYIGAADFSLPIGSVGRGDQDLTLRGGVTYPSTESLRNIPITTRTGKVIHLSDVADITEAREEKSSLSRYNGEENVTISVTKRQSASTLDVTDGVLATMEKLNAQNMGVHMSVISNSSEDIMASIRTVASTLVLGILLSMVVLYFFLGDWKASLIVGSSMPISVMATLILMNFMGFSLNVVSLGGLVIGVGMMVDNSIVVLESCFRLREQQLGAREAALEGTRVVTGSIIAGTLTTIVVFLPISLLKGMSGQLFRQLGFTIIFSLTASLLSAMTLVPLLFTRFKPQEKPGWKVNGWLKQVESAYGAFLRKSFQHKKAVVAVSLLLLAGSIGIATLIPAQLMPDIDQGTIAISVTAKPGLKLSQLDDLSRRLEQMVLECEDVERVSSTAGGGGVSAMMGGGGGSVSLTAYLKDNRKLSTTQVVDLWREQTKDYLGCEIDISASSMMSSMSSSNVEVALKGSDMDALRQAAQQVSNQLYTYPEIVRVSSSISDGSPQAEIQVDPIRAAAYGLTPKGVIGSVYTMISGSSPATLRQNGREYQVRLEYPKGRFEDVSDLSGLMVMSPAGTQVPLLDIATVSYANGPSSVMRENNQYIITVSGQPTTAAALTAGKKILPDIYQMELPTGVEIYQGSSAQQMMEEFSALVGAIFTAAALVFMVMAMQFESARFSIIVMICIPFALIGSFAVLFLSGATFSMPSLMGFLLLVGTVVNNGILFIDTANHLRDSMDAQSALVYAGQSRLRPILMTTLTTILSMVPLGLGIGSSAEMMQGMALVIIGGLIASTLLTLLLLPTFYLIFQKTDGPNGHPGRRFFGRKKGEADRERPSLSGDCQPEEEIRPEILC